MYKCTRKNSIVEKRRGSWWNLSCSYHVSGVGGLFFVLDGCLRGGEAGDGHAEG